jgi:hypothetical protein
MRTNRKLGWIAIGVDEDFEGAVPCTALDKIPCHDYDGSGQHNEKRTCTYRRVLKTMTTMSTKNPRARSASRERRKERYMTSIVLSSRNLTSVGEEALKREGTHSRRVLL